MGSYKELSEDQIKNLFWSVTPPEWIPAHIEGGTDATSVLATWQAVTDGSFKVEFDGVVLTITGLNFSAATSMDDVAAIIQAGVQLQTGSTEPVTWDGTRFWLWSVRTDLTSASSWAFAAGVGTDISGDGATPFLAWDAAATDIQFWGPTYQLSEADRGKAFIQSPPVTGSGVGFYLPKARPGLFYTFINMADTKLDVVFAEAGDTILIDKTEPVLYNALYTVNRGDVVSLVAINDTTWVASSYVGTFIAFV